MIKFPFLSIPLFSLSGISSWVDLDREKGGIERKGNFINYFQGPIKVPANSLYMYRRTYALTPCSQIFLILY